MVVFGLDLCGIARAVFIAFDKLALLSLPARCYFHWHEYYCHS
jgi:hypothetical protein